VPAGDLAERLVAGELEQRLDQQPPHRRGNLSLRSSLTIAHQI
jgi:hypothetical protein